jgi:hypothetical protein
MSGISRIFASSNWVERLPGRPSLSASTAEVGQSAWVRGAASTAESLAKKT